MTECQIRLPLSVENIAKYTMQKNGHTDSKCLTSFLGKEKIVREFAALIFIFRKEIFVDWLVDIKKQLAIPRQLFQSVLNTEINYQ